MIRNYILIATRNLKNSKFYSCFNIVGLSIGIACCLVIGLMVLGQLSYDQYHENADQIYRVVHREVAGDESRNRATSPGVLAPELLKNFSEVTEASRVAFLRTNVNVRGNENFEEQALAVDPSFFSIFTIPLKKNTNRKILHSASEILISQSLAVKLFGRRNAIGEQISVQDIGDFTIASVYEDFPFASHLQGNLIFSFSSIEKTQPLALSWNSNLHFNYALLSPEQNVGEFNRKLDAFIHKYTPEAWSQYEYHLQPLARVHIDDSYSGNPFSFIGETLIISFCTVAIIILMLACFNYMNMATARSARRAVEVGVRKVMGAYRTQLISQFMAESMILCTISFLLAILWADLALPFFNAFIGAELPLHMSDLFSDYWLVALLIGCNILVALAAGSYPAFFLSRFVPAVVLKGKQINDSSRRLRRGLVGLQFTLTGILIVTAIIVFKQADYMRNKDLGFTKENLALFGATPPKNISTETFKNELLKVPGVRQVTGSSTLLGRRAEVTELRNAGEPAEKNTKVAWLSIDHDYISTLKIPLLAGRNFYTNGSDGTRSVILNEQAAGLLGWTPQEAIGKRVSGFIFQDSLPGEVVGVVSDFHVSSLRRLIPPLVMNYTTDNNRFIARLEGPAPHDIRKRLDATLNKLIPGNTFQVRLIDDYLSEVYMVEEKMGQLLTFFTVLALIIGFLGLYALSAYEGEQRIKELGLRKIMGATSMELLILLSKNFFKPVIVALLISMPLAFLVGNFWLQTFPYHTSWSVGIFLQAAFLMFLMGWMAVMGQGIKASHLNPVDALRYE
jgi:putative ABC transport system permease protein